MANKKCMPLITTYKSDDSSLDDDDDYLWNGHRRNTSKDVIDEDDQPLSNFRHLQSSQRDFLGNMTNVPSSDGNNNHINSEGKQPISLCEEDSVLPNLSDSDDSASLSCSSDEEFKELVDEFSSLPVTELLKSKKFAMICSEKKREKCKSAEMMNTGYSQFFHEIQSTVKSEHPMINFYDLCRLINERWSQLSKNAKKEYKKRALVAVRSQQLTSFSEYRSKLLSLINENNKLCCNPSCQNPVIYDPRWNGQYCSTECVGEHCRLAFNDWCKSKPSDGKVMPSFSKIPATVNMDIKYNSKVLCDPVKSVQSIPVQSSVDKMNVNDSKSPCNDSSNNNSSNNTTTSTAISTSFNTTINNISNSNHSSDCLSISLKRKPLFESLRATQFSNRPILSKTASTTNTTALLTPPNQTASSSTSGPSVDLTLAAL
ncbi:unnamed protein product [Trichobilharzia szidati]|nr:unnamed protein product [Trichobilharzia szidati]